MKEEADPLREQCVELFSLRSITVICHGAGILPLHPGLIAKDLIFSPGRVLFCWVEVEVHAEGMQMDTLALLKSKADFLPRRRFRKGSRDSTQQQAQYKEVFHRRAGLK
jgi:hypothetical protein